MSMHRISASTHKDYTDDVKKRITQMSKTKLEDELTTLEKPQYPFNIGGMFKNWQVEQRG